MARIAVSLAGAAVGGYIGGPAGAQVGYALGSAAGSLAFAEDIKNIAPAIDDAQVTSAAYGQHLPRVFGVMPVGGRVLDASPVRKVLVESEAETGAKGGGPSVTTGTWNYYSDLFIAFHNGEISDVLRLRVDGEIVFDRTPDAQVVKPDWLKLTIYKGTDTQLPDPTFEALHGTGRVPAYRGIACLKIEDFPHTLFGNRFSHQFEILVAADATNATALQATQVSESGETSGGGGILREPSTELLIVPIINTSSQTYGLTAVDPYTRSVVWQTPSDGYKVFNNVSLKPKLVSTPAGLMAAPGEIACTLGSASDINYLARFDAISGQLLEVSPQKAGTGDYVRAMVYDWWDLNIQFTPYYIRDRGVFNGYDLLYGWDSETLVDEITGWYFTTLLVSDGAGHVLVSVADAETSPTSTGVAILDTDSKTFSDVAVTGDAITAVFADGAWWVLTQTSPAVIKQVDTTGAIVGTVDFSADYGITDSLNGSIVFDPTENTVYLQGLSTLYKLRLSLLAEPPTTYSIARNSEASVFHPPSGRIWYEPANEINAYSANLFAATGNSVSLASVVSDICTDGTQLTPSDIDVTALAGISVRGFTVGKAMARRNALRALMTTYLFDLVPRDGVLTAILRGGASSTTLTVDDIGAYLKGRDKPVPWVVTPAAPDNLPKQVEVIFVDPDQNYERGAQLAIRQASSLGKPETLQLALALSNDEAAQLADVHLHLRHIEAEAYETTTMPSTISDVQPGAVLDAVFEGESYRFRVVDAPVVEGGIIKMRGLREVPEVFSSYAVGGSPRAKDLSVKAVGPTILWPLDLPTLRTVDNNPGLVLAANTYTPGWPGADVQRSLDGVNFSTVSTVLTATPMGVVTNAPTTGRPVAWDLATVLQVQLIAGALYSTTRETPFYAAWGVNGRIEIVSYITAGQHADGYWLVSGLVRGLFDTGDHIATHAEGDQFVLLDTATLDRLSLPASAIDQVEILRAPTIGRSASSAPQVRIGFGAEGLAPFKPVRLHAYRDGSDNWVFSWKRQDRLYGRRFWPQPNNEADESYTLKILDDLGEVVRSITVTSATTYTYALADQVTDFGKGQTLMRWSVAQVSALVGDGHAAISVVGGDYDYPGTIVSDGALHYFRLEESAGPNAADDISTLDGTYQGAPTFDEAPLFRTGSAITLDGASDYVSWDVSAKSPSWLTGLELAFNVSGFPVSGYDVLWSHENTFAPSISAYLLVGSDNKLRLLLYRTSGVQVINLAGAALAVDTDYHVIVDWGYGNNANVDIYLNGSSYASGTTSNTWQLDTSNAGVMHLGHANSGSYGKFDGTVDDLSLWASVQSASQRADHFDRGGIA